MKTTRLDQKCRISDLIAEIISKGFNLKIENASVIGGRESPGPDGPAISIKTTQQVIDATHPQTRADGTFSHGETLLEALTLACNIIRVERGESHLDDEAEAIIESDAQHAAAGFVQYGTHAACTCGSQRPLEVPVKAIRRVSWRSGLSMGSHLEAFDRPAIATCPDCGKHWKLA